MAGLFLALLLAPTVLPPHVLEVEYVDPGRWVDGADHLLIAEAARHREMRGANLSCYRINVHKVRGATWVSFLNRRPRIIDEETEEGTIIHYLPIDPDCRSISFEMDARGRVKRVIYSRH